jgi:holin-like protein
VNALRGLAILLLLQAAGETLAHGLALPVPGPVLGMVLLLPALRWEWVARPVAECANFLLAHLSLLFVPVGVGVITQLPLLARHGAGLALAVVLSTWIGMAVTALVLRRLLRASEPAGDV